MSECRPERFFKVTARAGYLHLVDIRDWEGWDPARIVYRSDAEVAWILRVDRNARVARTRQDLDGVLNESRQFGRALSIYVYESLIREVESRWGQTREGTGTEIVLPEGQARETPT